MRVLNSHESGVVVDSFRGASGMEYSVRVSGSTIINYKHSDLMLETDGLVDRRSYNKYKHKKR